MISNTSYNITLPGAAGGPRFHVQVQKFSHCAAISLSLRITQRHVTILHHTGVLIVPFLAPVSTSTGGLGDSQWKSPCATCICTTSPVSLSNLQVSVGGINDLQSTFQYGYEHFLDQVNLCEQLTFSEIRYFYRFNQSKLLEK
jgi:hypothetical protein